MSHIGTIFKHEQYRSHIHFDRFFLLQLLFSLQLHFNIPPQVFNRSYVLKCILFSQRQIKVILEGMVSIETAIHVVEQIILH